MCWGLWPAGRRTAPSHHSSHLSSHQGHHLHGCDIFSHHQEALNEVWLTVEWSFPSLIQHYHIRSSRASLYKHWGWQWKTHLLSPPLSSRLSSPHTQTQPCGSDKQTNEITEIVFVEDYLSYITCVGQKTDIWPHACIYVHSLGNSTTSHKVLLLLISESVLSSRCLQLRNSDEVEFKAPTRERDTCHHV